MKDSDQERDCYINDSPFISVLIYEGFLENLLL